MLGFSEGIRIRQRHEPQSSYQRAGTLWVPARCPVGRWRPGARCVLRAEHAEQAVFLVVDARANHRQFVPPVAVVPGVRLHRPGSVNGLPVAASTICPVAWPAKPRPFLAKM